MQVDSSKSPRKLLYNGLFLLSITGASAFLGIGITRAIHLFQSRSVPTSIADISKERLNKALVLKPIHIGLEVKDISLGTIDAGAIFKQTIIVKNNHSTSLTLTTLQSSCGCTSLTSEIVLPRTLLPDDELQLNYSIAPTNQEGTFSSQVTGMFKETYDCFTVEFSGTAVPLLKVIPDHVLVNRGDSIKTTIQITAGRRTLDQLQILSPVKEFEFKHVEIPEHLAAFESESIRIEAAIFQNAPARIPIVILSEHAPVARFELITTNKTQLKVR